MKHFKVTINMNGYRLFGFLSATDIESAIAKYDTEFPNFAGCLEDIEEYIH